VSHEADLPRRHTQPAEEVHRRVRERTRHRIGRFTSGLQSNVVRCPA
jgi:hypothetical protein